MTLRDRKLPVGERVGSAPENSRGQAGTDSSYLLSVLHVRRRLKGAISGIFRPDLPTLPSPYRFGRVTFCGFH